MRHYNNANNNKIDTDTTPFQAAYIVHIEVIINHVYIGLWITHHKYTHIIFMMSYPQSDILSINAT